MEMIGATVLQKGTNNGIVTGLDGKFTLTLSNEAEQTLLISMIGFIEQSITIKRIILLSMSPWKKTLHN